MKFPRLAISITLSLFLLNTLSSCKSIKAKPDADATAAKDAKDKADPKKDTKPGEKPGESTTTPTQAATEAGPIDVSFLLSMSYAEAKTLSANFIEIPPFYKIAADEIEITRRDEDGTPSRVRAKGRVFVEMNYLEPAKALCQELLLNPEELILRGKPVLQRGTSTVEGVDDYTIFYMYGTRLRVIGPHRLTNPDKLAASVDASGLPTLGAWSSAPNPLLPPLTEGAVPDMIRLEAQQAAEAEALHQRTRNEMGAPSLSGPASPPETPKKDSKPKETPPAPASTAPQKGPIPLQEPDKAASPSKTPETPKSPTKTEAPAKVESATKDAKAKIEAETTKSKAK